MALWNLFRKRPKPLSDETALRFVTGDKVHDISYKELCVTNKLSIEALVSLLIRKELVNPQELLEEIKKVSATFHTTGPIPPRNSDNGDGQSKHGS